MLLLCRKAQKGYIHAILEFSFLLCSPKRPVLKSLFSSYSVFSFSFCLPFQIPFFLAFCPSAPFWNTLFWGGGGGGSFDFFFLPFRFLMFACFFETNSPNILFLKPKLLSFVSLFLFSSVVFVFVLMVYVSAFLFLCWICFWHFFVFVLFLVLLSIYEKDNILPAILVFFELCWLKGSFGFYVFVLACLLLVLFVCSLNNEVTLFCVGVVCFLFFVTRLCGFPVCLLWSCFVSVVLCSILFLHPFQKIPKIRTQQKIQNLLAQLCS